MDTYSLSHPVRFRTIDDCGGDDCLMQDTGTKSTPVGDRFDEAARALKKSVSQTPRDSNAVLDMQADLRQSVGDLQPDWIDQTTPAGAFLEPLLAALEWNGESRHLFEALPHFDRIEGIETLRAVLSRLNIDTPPRKTSLADLSPSLLPCLFESRRGEMYVALERNEKGDVLVFDGASRSFVYVPATQEPGTAYQARRNIKPTEQTLSSGRPWFEDVLSRFRSTLVTLIVLSLVMNVLSMLLPVYVMQVYDKVIGTQSLPTLMSLLSGIAIAIGAEVKLRKMRAHSLAFLGGRFESLVSISVVQQLLNFPISMTESVSAGNQITRLNQFEGIREAFVGPLGTAILDLPFVLLFCALVFIIGGPLGWVPVTMVVVLLIMGAIAGPISARLVAKAGEARTQNRNSLMELTQNHGTLREMAAEDVWVDRYRQVAADHFHRQFQAQQFTSVIQTVSQSLVMSSGVATLYLGTLMVLAGDLSIGALIAIMALVWRVLSPLQAAFASLNRMGQIVPSIRQINRMMKISPERLPGQLPSIHRQLKGRIEVSQVSFKYSPRGEPVLRGVNLSIKPGELVAIIGGSGAGKSSLLNIVDGLYKPQAGAVLV
ncbi:MAG: peptidase domain-containing ABC transporter, partial [Halocynthiibacter sp.]